MQDLERLIPPESVAAYDQPMGKEVYPTREAAIRAAIARAIRAWPGMRENEALPEYHELVLPLPDPKL